VRLDFAVCQQSSFNAAPRTTLLFGACEQFLRTYSFRRVGCVGYNSKVSHVRHVCNCWHNVVRESHIPPPSYGPARSTFHPHPSVLRERYRNLKIRAFWDIATCSLAGVDRRFRGAYCLHYQSDIGARLQGAISQKALIIIFTCLRTWNLTHKFVERSISLCGRRLRQ
jgi:hypothetical protein